MKYFNVTAPGHSYVIAADSVVEIDEFAPLHELSLRVCLDEKRPISIRNNVYRNSPGWRTWYADRLPVHVSGLSFRKVRPHECL